MREVGDIAQDDSTDDEAQGRQSPEGPQQHVPIEEREDDTGKDDRGGRPKRRHRSHDAHVGAEFLARRDLERDVHPYGYEHTRAESLDNASGEQYSEIVRQGADDRAYNKESHGHAEQRTRRKRTVREGGDRDHDRSAEHVGSGKPLHCGHTYAQAGHDRREADIEEGLVEGC